MKFRLIDLEEFLSTSKINWKKIINELNKKSFETNLFKDYLEVEILPNRFVDAGNIRGLAKEISLITGIKFKDIKFKINEKNYPSPVKLKVITKNCPYYFGRAIFNIKNKKSPVWLVNFLKFYGINSINFITDLSNYVMIQFGAPIHIFDLDKIQNKTIIVRQAKSNEKFISLKEKEYLLTPEDIVIADQEKILALAGIQGSNLAKVDLTTKNIFIEAAVFDNFSIYKTSRRLNLITEASYRFERKVIPENSLLALNYLTFLIKKELGGEINKLIYSTQQKLAPQKRKIILDLDKLYQYYGSEIKVNLVLSILKKLNIRVIVKNKNQLILSIPDNRLDLTSDVDIIEEIIRIIGYDKLPVFYPQQFNYPQKNNLMSFKEKIRDLLIQIGFQEIISYSFIDENDLNNLRSIFHFQPVEIINPNSNLYKFYRPYIFPNLFKAVAKNLSLYNWLETKNFKLFEIGKTAYYQNDKITETHHLSLVITDDDLKTAFIHIKGVLSKLFEFLGIDNVYFNNQIKDNFDLMSEILINKNKIGWLLSPNSKLLDYYDIKQPLISAEISLDQLFNYQKVKKKFITIPQFPAVFRDLSLVVPFYLKKEDIEKEIKNTSIDLLEKINVLDIYYLNDQEKSITFHLIFRHKNRTLKDEEVNEIMEKIVKRLKDKFNVTVR